jgi:hypothetical protein
MLVAFLGFKVVLKGNVFVVFALVLVRAFFRRIAATCSVPA